MAKDHVTFSNKKYQENFDKTRDLLFNDLENILIEHEQENDYIKNPENNMSKSNLDFQRSITIDHIVMTILNKIK